VTKRKSALKRALKIQPDGTKTAGKIKFYVYADVNSEYRWRLVAKNNSVIADSGEGYKNVADILSAIELVMDTDRATVIVDKQNFS